MKLQCPECRRVNPSEAVFCYHDGKPLNGAMGSAEATSINYAVWAFPTPFVFPSGAKCHNFLQMALACKRDPREAIQVLQQGFIDRFLGSVGRVDLAMAAQAAAKNPDPDRALDELLSKLPGAPQEPAQLDVQPQEKNLGILQKGDDRTFELTLTNKGDRLLQGKATIENCPWLGLGDSATPEKVFQCFASTTLVVRVRGDRLQAANQPRQAEIAIESNGGNFIIPVTLTVPVKPFPEGVLSGATSPRQIAEKAKAHPKEAAVLLENGAVARWYESNGWSYPVQGPTASGLAAVQQFFETLGLVKAPRVDVSEHSISLRGKPGERLEYVLTVLTQEKRAAFAHAFSDQTWLSIGKPVFRGQMATIPLTVTSVPPEPGRALQALVRVTANGNQRFDVPVTLQIGDGPVAASAVPTSMPVQTVTASPPPPPRPPSHPEPAPASYDPFNFHAEPAPVPVPMPVPVPVSAPAAMPPAAIPAPSDPAKKAARKDLMIRLLPVAIVVIGLLTAVVRDLLFAEEGQKPLPEIDYEHPRLALHFHDAPLPNDYVPFTSMRFGLGIPDPAEPGKFKTRLIYDPQGMGRTNNVILRVGTQDYMLGRDGGAWKPPIKEPLGTDKITGRKLIGYKSVWQRSGPAPVTVTQYVEIVPGGLSPDGKKQLLDTCLIRYDLTNDYSAPLELGLRFLLDTYIGGNDGVPFTIAGANELTDTMKDFKTPAEVPDYICALERQDVKNPGTVAYINLKYGGLEPPNRVTLGAWPADEVREHRAQYPEAEKANRQETGWVVPVVPMKLAKSAQNPDGDSAVTLYWDNKLVEPGKTRTVGFAYGLGSVTGDQSGGQLGMIAGGELVEEKEFTLTAYVKNPAPGTTITLTLPKGLKLAGGTEKENVPAIPAGSSSAYSPVTWRVKAAKSGVYRVKVTLSSGATLTHRFGVAPARIF